MIATSRSRQDWNRWPSKTPSHTSKSTSVEIYHEQANVFSAIVGIMGTRALDAVSNYEKHKHLHTAQQRFPDLCRRGCGSADPRHCLESKGSKRPWAIQSHYDHSGWYIVWRYLVDPTETIEPGKPVIIWRVDVVFLERSDWKYEKSSAGTTGGGRTHTFGIKNPAAKLTGCAAYRRTDVVTRDGKPVSIDLPESEASAADDTNVSDST